MSLKKIVFTFLAIFLYNFAIAQKATVRIVEDINQRTLLNHVNFDQHVNHSGTIVMYICADNPGNVTQVQVLRSKSTIKDIKTLSAIANEALHLKFDVVKNALTQCGEMTFNFDESSLGRKDVVAASKVGARKIFGSRPTPPNTNTETGDLSTRKTLLNADMDGLTNEKGQVVVYLCADKYGRVIKAEPVGKQSTIKHEEILSEVAVRLKRQMKFSPGKQFDCMYYTVKIE